MTLKSIELTGFKSFAKKTQLVFSSPIVAIVGPNGSGKSNIVEAIRFVLGEQSMKSLRGKGGGDLVWKGSKNLNASSRAMIAITFDNSKHLFSFPGRDEAPEIHFDEVVISREIESDGGSVYRINGTEVRLKDIIEMLSSVHIGSTGHHIISQGEADRILSANSRDRRAMIEDALGLKIYQYKIRESERKLEHTRENMKEVSSLRRELSPHLVFLKKQVEKIEKAETLRQELESLYIRYFSTESYYQKYERARLEKTRKELEADIEEKSRKLEKLEITRNSGTEEKTDDLGPLKQKLAELSQTRDSLSRALGRIEGALEAINRVGNVKSAGTRAIAYEKIEPLILSVTQEIDTLLSGDSDVGILRASLSRIRSALLTSWNSLKSPEKEENVVDKEKIVEQEEERARIKEELETIAAEERHLNEEINSKTAAIVNAEARIREEERYYYSAVAEKKTKEAELENLTLREEALRTRTEELENALKEAGALIGPHAIRYESTKEELGREERTQLLRTLERTKIKLEDIGGGGSEVLKEFEDTQTREQFLAKEYGDLEAGVKSLESLINELKETLETEFKVGVDKINDEFTKFFALMFGGGHASLRVIVENKRVYHTEEDEGDIIDEEEVPLEKGIEINVSLPHKKVRDLAMLSGGERSLTSIALLFAMSQVNPPPFLVLDETDAALDEANSRRYGDMLENLAKYSQLVVVTHNRETMSRADILYGITVGADGSSKLLSIKFDEAVKIAK